MRVATTESVPQTPRGSRRMAQIFRVECPSCREIFPCHTELWQAPYDLLCPFCQHTFPQEQSPMIISPAGERRERKPRAEDSTAV